MSVRPGTVHVVDDDASWRTSVARLLSAAGYTVALYESAEGFLQSADVAPGCILLDLRMPGLTGLQLQQHLSQMRRALPIVFVSGHGDISTTVLAIKAGAEDFLPKPVATDVLLGAVERAIARDQGDRGRREQLKAWLSRYGSLTPSEQRVFSLLVRGKLNKQVGAELNTTERTAKWHRHNLMEKLQVRSIAELVLMAERLDLVGERTYPVAGSG